jgi:hypothetical protein
MSSVLPDDLVAEIRENNALMCVMLHDVSSALYGSGVSVKLAALTAILSARMMLEHAETYDEIDKPAAEVFADLFACACVATIREADDAGETLQ